MGEKWMKASEERRRRLAKIVNALRKIGFNFNVNRFDDRLKLQKYLFLLRRYGIDLGYSYNFYIRGPYSPDLANDYYNLPSVSEEEELPEEFVELVRGKSERWLELASSLVMVFERYPDIADEEAIELVSESKSAKLETLRRILRELKKHRAI